MIPKIIHVCWLSGDDFPESIKNCLHTWTKHLTGYKLFFWGKLPQDISCLSGMHIEVKWFDLDSVIWTKQAFETRKYAFAADYIRLYALYNYGGIYLDSDVVMYKAFDDLLDLPYFIGEDQIHAFEAAVIGAEKGCKWIKDILDTYTNKSFITEEGNYDTLPLPCRFHHILVNANYKFQKISTIVPFTNLPQKLYVFDKDFFNSRNSIEVQKTEKSYCAHNYAGSWQKKQTQKGLKQMLPKWMLKTIYVVGQNTWARKKYSWFQIPFE